MTPLTIWAEETDEGYLEDLATTTMTDVELAAALQGTPYPDMDYTWTLTAGSNTGTYYCPTVTASSNCVTITGYGGGGGGGGTTTNDWIYLGASGVTITPYEEPMVAEPLTQEQATRAWLQAAQREWLRAEAQWKDGEKQRQREDAKEKAEALLISLLPR
jgi:hypothetical protein